MTVTIHINGRKIEVTEGKTILQAAQHAGIYIPTLCNLDMLEPYGGCRLCMVQVDNMRGLPIACTTPVSENMVVSTKTPELQKLRREILELILSEHPYTCLVCKDKDGCTEFMHTTRKVSTTTGCNFCSSNGDCELQDLVDYLALKEIRFPVVYRNLPPVNDNPFYTIDYNLCILCGRCIRICNEERHSNVLAFVQRGNAALVGTAFNESQKDAGCEFCGACVDVCPTGTLSEKIGRWVGVPDRSTETTCPLCSTGCLMNVNTRGNRIVNVGPAPGKRTSPPQLCVRGKFMPPEIFQHPDRALWPMIRKNGKWIDSGWKVTIKYITERLEMFKGSGFGLIGSSHETLENNYILQKFTREVMLSHNVDTDSIHTNPHLVKLIHDHYNFQDPVRPDEIADHGTIIVIGTDASVTHPMVENRIRKAFMDGRNVICIHSIKSRTSLFAKREIFYKPGYVSEFLKNDLENIIRHQDTDSSILIIAGNEVLTGNNCLYNVSFLTDLLKDTPDDVNIRIMFLLNEANTYGSNIAGMNPCYRPGLELIVEPGKSVDGMMNSISDKGIRALMGFGDVPVREDLKNLDLLIHCNIFKTPLTELADVFVPVPGFIETEGHIMSEERTPKSLKSVISPPEEIMQIWEIVTGITADMGANGFDYSSSFDIYKELWPIIDSEKQIIKDSEIIREVVDNKSFSVVLPDTATNLTGSFNITGNDLSLLSKDLRMILDKNALID